MLLVFCFGENASLSAVYIGSKLIETRSTLKQLCDYDMYFLHS